MKLPPMDSGSRMQATGMFQSVNLFLSSKGMDCPKFSSSILGTPHQGFAMEKEAAAPLPSYIVASLIPQQISASGVKILSIVD